MKPHQKSGSDKINRLKSRRKKHNRKQVVSQLELTNENPELREVALELSAKKGIHRTKALVSLC